MNDKETLIAEKISEIMELLNIKITDSNKDTPRRIAKMYNNEVFKNISRNDPTEDFKVTLFDAENKNRIGVKVPVKSMCEHHWLPFIGEATITYIPNKKIIGLSKIPRIVKFFSQKPQLQERLTNEIGEYLVSVLDPDYLCIKIVAEHTCVSMRGAESPCETTTLFTYEGSEMY